MLKRCLLLATLFCTTPLFADSTIVTADSFAQVQQMVEKDKQPHHLLLALDDDDTLTMMPCPSPSHCQYLGGPAWYTWQSQLPATSPVRIWKTFPQLLAINNLLFTMSEMPLTDKTIPAALQLTHQRGAYIVVASARGYDMMNATEKQFKDNGILNIIKESAIPTPRDHISFPGFYMPTPWRKEPVRPIAYVHGILYWEGQNKGVMLQQFLAKTKKTNAIKEIIFVDDQHSNVVDVAKAYKNDPHVHVISVYYTKLKEHKAEFLTGKNAKKLQATANAQWFAIRDALRKNVLGFNL